MTTNNYYNNMKWKPKIGTIYCVADEATKKINLFYEVAELTLNDYFVECEALEITYKVYDYRHPKNVNNYYVKLKLFIHDKHINKDLVIRFQHDHGEDKLATHTITRAHSPIVYKTEQDTKATRTRLKKLLINDVYLCKYNNFVCNYSVEEFYTLYNILSKNHRLFGDIINPYDALYDKIMSGVYKYDFLDYTKQEFSQMCYFNNIYDKLKSQNQDDEEDE